jgi:hypothetical protein
MEKVQKPSDSDSIPGFMKETLSLKMLFTQNWIVF